MNARADSVLTGKKVLARSFVIGLSRLPSQPSRRSGSTRATPARGIHRNPVRSGGKR